MKNKVRRPPSVWMAQLIILLLSIPFLIGVGRPVFRCLFSGPSSCVAANIIVKLVVVLAGIIAILFMTVLGLQKGKLYGKWLGVALLTVLVGILLNNEPSRMLYGYIFSLGEKSSALPDQYYNYSNQTQLLTAALFNISLDIGLILLILRLAFARSVQNFFESPKIEASQSDDPPLHLG